MKQAKANRVLPREHTDHSKHPLPTTQEKTLHMDITRWTILKSDSKDAEALYRQQKQDQKLTTAQIMNSIAKFRLEIEESRENHQVIQVRPKSNPLQLYSGSDKQIQGMRSDRVPEELQTEVHDIVQEAVIKTIPKKKKCKKAKWFSEEALQITVKRRQRREGKICPSECRVPKNSEEI